MTNEELVTRIKAGIDVTDNMQRLWEQNRTLIRDAAKRYKGYADMEDLEQEGYLALYDAIEGYSPEQGYKFMTYAKHWIRQRMKRYIDNYCNAIRIPVHEKDKLQKYHKMANAFGMSLNRKPTKQELAYNMGLSIQQVCNLEMDAGIEKVGSLDRYIADDEEGGTVYDMIPGNMDIESTVLDKVEAEQLKAVIWDVVDTLTDRQSRVIKSRYWERKTLKETGKDIGVTLERVRKIESEAIKELRKPSRSKRLAPFLPEAVEAKAYRHSGAREFSRTWTSTTEGAALLEMERFMKLYS